MREVIGTPESRDIKIIIEENNKHAYNLSKKN
jgi:hypothetical protein